MATLLGNFTFCLSVCYCHAFFPGHTLSHMDCSRGLPPRMLLQLCANPDLIHMRLIIASPPHPGVISLLSLLPPENHSRGESLSI